MLGLILILSVSAYVVLSGGVPPPGTCTGTDNGAIMGDCPKPGKDDGWVACCIAGRTGCGVSFDGGDTCLPDEDFGGEGDDYYVDLPGNGRCLDGTFNYDSDTCPEEHYMCRVIEVDGVSTPACIDSDKLTLPLPWVLEDQFCCTDGICFSYYCIGGEPADSGSCSFEPGSCIDTGNCFCGTSYEGIDYEAYEYITGFCPGEKETEPGTACFDETTCANTEGGAGGVCKPGLKCAVYKEWVGFPAEQKDVAACGTASTSKNHCCAFGGEWVDGSCEFYDGTGDCYSGTCADAASCQKKGCTGTVACSSGYVCSEGSCVSEGEEEEPEPEEEITGVCPTIPEEECRDEGTCPGGESCADGYQCLSLPTGSECIPEDEILDGCNVPQEMVVWYNGDEVLEESSVGAPVMMVLVASDGEDCEGVHASFAIYDEDNELVRGTEDDTMEADFIYDDENDAFYTFGEWTPLYGDVFYYFRAVLSKDDKLKVTDNSDILNVLAEGCVMPEADCSAVCEADWTESGHELGQDDDCDGICDCVDQWIYFSGPDSDDGIPDGLEACFEGGIDASCSNVPWEECEASDVTGKYERKRVLRACNDGETSGCCQIDGELCETSLPSVYGSGIQSKACLPDEVEEFPVFTWLNMLAVSLLIAGYYAFTKKQK
ncbi:MAG: hypothetical protein ABIB71_07565 [Candidatus Woesearchaeota archaeon]